MMDCGVKRVIKNEDVVSLFSFYKTRHVKTLDQIIFQKWIESQKQHFEQKTEIEKIQKYRKEGFIVQEVFKRGAGQDKPPAPKTVGALILKLAEYKTPEIKGFVLDEAMTDRTNIDKCVNVLMKDVDELCKKEGYDTYLVFTNMMNGTAQTIFNSSLFSMDRILGKSVEKQEFVFKRNINPSYMGDPFNWLEKVLWYMKYFIGQEFKDLAYRTGLKIQAYKLPIINKCIIYPKTNNHSRETQEIKACFVILDDTPDDINKILSPHNLNDRDVIFLFSRQTVRKIKNVICISEEKINQIIRITWGK